VSINPPIIAISIAPRRYFHQLIEKTKECVAHLECKLHQQIAIGDHTPFIGRVLTAYADDGVFDEKFDLKKVKPKKLHVSEEPRVTSLIDGFPSVFMTKPVGTP